MTNPDKPEPLNYAPPPQRKTNSIWHLLLSLLIVLIAVLLCTLAIALLLYESCSSFM